jgi:hypothetical protein
LSGYIFVVKRRWSVPEASMVFKNILFKYRR